MAAMESLSFCGPQLQVHPLPPIAHAPMPIGVIDRSLLPNRLVSISASSFCRLVCGLHFPGVVLQSAFLNPYSQKGTTVQFIEGKELVESDALVAAFEFYIRNLRWVCTSTASDTCLGVKKDLEVMKSIAEETGTVFSASRSAGGERGRLKLLHDVNNIFH